MATGSVIPFSSRKRKPGSRNLIDKGGRRSGWDRRKQSLATIPGERRDGRERRSGRDRRCFRGFKPRKIEERRRVFLKTTLYSLSANRNPRNSH